MSTTILQALEFDRVLLDLQRHCQFSVAAERVLSLGPTADASQVHYLLDVTAEAVGLLEVQHTFSVGGVRDIRAALERASLGGVLQPHDLLQVLDTVSNARNLRRAFLRMERADDRFPHLAEFIDTIVEFPVLEADIGRAIGERGDVLDSASEALGTIRRDLRRSHARVVERMNRYITSSTHTAALQDLLITTRDGRYVVPVRADRRSQLPGVVHDTSSSGQTLFVEPMDVVELNNRWKELQAAERHEIERILAALSHAVGVAAERLNISIDAVSAIDIALAKARYAAALRATRPTITERGQPDGRRVILHRARHPLLDPLMVVPIDMHLDNEQRVLIITGPNTGGKTVSLKTTGLLMLMAQCGLYIPADEGSSTCVVDGVFADIGDEQSIEQNLSTFSSHMVRVISTLRGATEDSLVLLDELGAGTDPQEGAALARALVTTLLERGCFAIATTHYSELKSFAWATPGVQNASVEFNIETLSPTYRLMIGVPGQSNALAIAERLGMPTDVIALARGWLDPELERVDVLLDQIRSLRDEAEQAARDARAMTAAAAQERATARAERIEAEANRVQARTEALEEIEAELAQARQTVRRIRDTPTQRRPMQPSAPPTAAANAGTSTTDAADVSPTEARHTLDQAAAAIRRAARRRSRPPVMDTLRVGDTVELRALGGEGEVLRFSDDGTQADIQMGAFKVRQPLATLRRLSKAQASQQSPRRSTPMIPPPSRHVDMELHLRGQRAAGIDDLLDEYLNDAYLSRLPYVRIVHGKGTGVLREVVHQIVGKHPLVDRWETPPAYEGGDGVTIAYLREG